MHYVYRNTYPQQQVEKEDTFWARKKVWEGLEKKEGGNDVSISWSQNLKMWFWVLILKNYKDTQTLNLSELEDA